MSISIIRSRRTTLRLVGAMSLSLILAATAEVHAQPKSRTKSTPATSATAAYERLLQGAYAQNGPGAAVIVVKEGKTLFRQAQGLADLELGVPLQPDMVFRLGSITKQFTAAAILLLAEDGKLSVQDRIEKHLPGYPTHGHTITIEHLLTHTSGIQSYTSIPGWMTEKIVAPMKVQEIIDGFKKEPMTFAPGERYLYNNSAYILLGAIIEKVSGKSYDKSFTHLKFEVEASGKVTGMIMYPEGSEKGEAASREAGAPAERPVVKVDPALYDEYVGDYELGPNFVLTVSRDGDRLMTQATGQSKVEVFPSSNTEFFLKVVDARIVFTKGPSGAVEALVLYQGGREMRAPKKK